MTHTLKRADALIVGDVEKDNEMTDYLDFEGDDNEYPEPTPLEVAIHNLAACREEQAACKDDYDREAEAWKLAIAPFLERHSQAVASTAGAEAAVRKLALEAYHASGGLDKHPHAAVTVKVMRKLSDYSVAAATEWAKVNAPFVLTVDAKQFEKLAKDGVVPDTIAEVKEVAQTAIAADLHKWL